MRNRMVVYMNEMTPEQVRAMTQTFEVFDAVQDVDFTVTYRPDGLEDGLILLTLKAVRSAWIESGEPELRAEYLKRLLATA